MNTLISFLLKVSSVDRQKMITKYSGLYDFSVYCSPGTYSPICSSIPSLSQAVSRQSSTRTHLFVPFFHKPELSYDGRIFTIIDTPWASSARASTAAHGRKMPILRQRTRSPYHGRRRLLSVCCDSSWDGKKYSTSARAI